MDLQWKLLQALVHLGKTAPAQAIRQRAQVMFKPGRGERDEETKKKERPDCVETRLSNHQLHD